MAGIRLHTFWSTLRNYVLEAIQTRTVSNFDAFYYMFIVNVGLNKEPEFARTNIHQKLKQKHAFYLENTKIVQSVCTEVLFVLDSKKIQVENVFPIESSVFLQQQLSDTGRPMRQIVGYAHTLHVGNHVRPESNEPRREKNRLRGFTTRLDLNRPAQLQRLATDSTNRCV